MKQRIISVFLLLVMFLNIMGYYWILVALHHDSVISFEKKLVADNYLDSETLTFEFPLSIPYYPDSRDYEPAKGQFEFEGEYYHLVKQRYAGDTLYLVCVKNLSTQRVKEALSDYVKTFADKTEGSGKTIKNLSNYIKDYLGHSCGVVSQTTGWSNDLQIGSVPPLYAGAFLSLITQPPEVC